MLCESFIGEDSLPSQSNIISTTSKYSVFNIISSRSRSGSWERTWTWRRRAQHPAMTPSLVFLSVEPAHGPQARGHDTAGNSYYIYKVTVWGPVCRSGRQRLSVASITYSTPIGQLSLLLSGVGRWVPASAGKTKAGTVHSVSPSPYDQYCVGGTLSLT